MVLGISLREAWVKFRAPSPSLEEGLDAGRGLDQPGDGDYLAQRRPDALPIALMRSCWLAATNASLMPPVRFKSTGVRKNRGGVPSSG